MKPIRAEEQMMVVIGDATCIGGAKTNCDDNCVTVFNQSQENSDSDGIGDACEEP